MFNTREYQWSDLTLVLGGKDITGFRGLSYTEKQEKEAIYGKGSEPHSIQRGNKSYEGELTILQSELESLTKNAPNKDIMSLNLDAVVCYGDPRNGDMMITDILQGLEFTEVPKTLNQGDKNMEIKIPFIFTRIKHQVA